MGVGTKKGKFGLAYIYKIQSRNPIEHIIVTKQTVCNRYLQILASSYLPIYLSSLVLIVDYGRKWCHFSLKGICWPYGIIEKSV